MRGTEEALDGNFFLCDLVEALDKLAGQDRNGDLKMEVGISLRKHEFKQLVKYTNYANTDKSAAQISLVFHIDHQHTVNPV